MSAGTEVLSPQGRFWRFSCIYILIPSLSACDSGLLFKSADALKPSAQKALEEKNDSNAAMAASALIAKQLDDHEGYFLLAQAEAQLGDGNAGVSALEHAIKHGFDDDAQIDNDALLDPIRVMPAYGSLATKNFPNRGDPESDAASILQDGTSQEVRAGDVVIKLNPIWKMETRPCSI